MFAMGIYHYDCAMSIAGSVESMETARGDANVVTIHLVRHGQTTTYDYDAGLTILGQKQAASYAQCLKTVLPPSAPVMIVHSATARTYETAQAICKELRTERRDISLPQRDDAFRNMQVFVAGIGLEPTRARPLLEESGDHEGWAVEAQRFWDVHSAKGDPVAFWMNTPLLWHEPPADVVRRLLHHCEERARDLPLRTHLIAITHEGCLRSILSWVRGADPGPLKNLSELRLIYNRVTGLVLLEQNGKPTALPPTR